MDVSSPKSHCAKVRAYCSAFQESSFFEEYHKFSEIGVHALSQMRYLKKRIVLITHSAVNQAAGLHAAGAANRVINSAKEVSSPFK